MFCSLFFCLIRGKSGPGPFRDRDQPTFSAPEGSNLSAILGPYPTGVGYKIVLQDHPEGENMFYDDSTCKIAPVAPGAKFGKSGPIRPFLLLSYAKVYTILFPSNHKKI